MYSNINICCEEGMGRNEISMAWILDWRQERRRRQKRCSLGPAAMLAGCGHRGTLAAMFRDWDFTRFRVGRSTLHANKMWLSRIFMVDLVVFIMWACALKSFFSFCSSPCAYAAMYDMEQSAFRPSFAHPVLKRPGTEWVKDAVQTFCIRTQALLGMCLPRCG